MSDIYVVKLTRKALKDLRKVPLYIAIKLQAWIDEVQHLGLSHARKLPGYHDELLRGKRDGQRSIRLNKSYRAIYIIKNSNKIKCVEIIEVNNHEY